MGLYIPGVRGGMHCLVALVAIGSIACGPADAAPAAELEGVARVPGAPPPDLAAASDRSGPTGAEAARAGSVSAEDREIFERTMRWALAERLDTLPIGSAVARMGRRFVGSPYRPGTLDPPGPEGLVVNLREFDCVTFVESALAHARTVRAPDPSFDVFLGELERLRYRGGIRDGYASRLHYFSEWIADNAARDVLSLVTPELGGTIDPEPIDFMTTHREAYRQLADTLALREIRAIERRLSDAPRYVLAERAIAEAEHGIREGDVIAATSTVPGLDVAHTGIAVAIDGRIHLMHAPLVGDSVQISEVPLADRVARIGTQDGVMVARPR